jgi:integrase
MVALREPTLQALEPPQGQAPAPPQSALERLRAIFPGLSELPGRVAARTLAGYLYDAHLYLTWCTGDPARALEPQTFRAWLQHQVAAGLAPNPLTLVGLRDRALVFTLASSGCRLHEVARLQRAHLVPLGTGYGLHVTGKGQATPRLAPLSREAYEWITRWLTARDGHQPCAWIFTGFGPRGWRPHTRPLNNTSLWRRIKQYARQIGRPDISPHDLRRFVGTQTAEKYGIRQAQKALGHKKIQTTERYVLDTLAADVTEGLY